MSVVRQLLQISAVQALRGQTLAGAGVFDSKIGPLPDILKGAERPILVVSIEESDQRSEGGNDTGFFGRTAELKMLVQAAVASPVSVTIDDVEAITAGIGETDAGYEATLNLLDRQWRAVFHLPGNPWAELFRSLIASIGDIRDARGINPENGHRHAARFTQIDIRTICEPAPGEDIPEDIERGLQMLSDVPDYAELAILLRESLTSGSQMSDWQKVQSLLFAGTDTLSAVGLAPLAGDDDELATAIIAMEGAGSIEVVGDV